MMRSDGRLPSVTALRAFSVAGRHSSLAAAAVELAVSPGAVSRQIIALESAIGLRLFLRQSGGITLTEQGRVYHDQIASAFNDMLAATRDLFAPADTNRVMISVLPTFAMRWLVPRLPRFSRLYPALELEVMTGDGAPEPNGPWNLAIRYGNDIWPGLDATRLLNEEMIVVCAPSLAQSSISLASVPASALLKHLTRPKAWERLFHQAGLAPPLLTGRRSFDHLFMLVEAARLGQGFALVPRYVVDDELRAGSLVQPVIEVLLPQEGYVMLRRRGPQGRAVNIVFDWLARQAAAEHQN